MRALIAVLRRHRTWVRVVASCALLGGIFLGLAPAEKHIPEAWQPPLPRDSALSIYQLPAHWTTDDDRDFELKSLGGRCQMLTLLFASCTGTCPLTVKSLQVFVASLSKSEAKKLGFVSLTIDPADTGAVLREYRESMKLGPDWILLRGAPGNVRELAATLGFNYEGEGAQFAHTNMVTLLDTAGVVVHQQAGVGGSQDELKRALDRFCPSDGTADVKRSDSAPSGA